MEEPKDPPLQLRPPSTLRKRTKGAPTWAPLSALGTGTACAAAQAVRGGLDPV